VLDDSPLQILLSGPGELEAIAERLVQTALERNGSDNITAVLVRAE
jgi:serine/threonine protein phosphatase PrpC